MDLITSFRSMSDEEIKNRAKQGGFAFIGSFAIATLGVHRAAAEIGKDPDFGKTLKFSAGLALLAGAAWAAMPQARLSAEEAIEKTKEAIMPGLKVALKRVIEAEAGINETPIRAATPAAPSTSYEAYRRQSTAVAAEKPKVESRTGVFSLDDDFVTDEEYALMLDAEIKEKVPRSGGPAFGQEDLDDPFPD